ncbi:acetolactate synthase small subunit [Candidatus Pseudomonas adelgestsugas]
MRHIISLRLENELGALSRVASLFSQRNYNIERLTIANLPKIRLLSRLILTTIWHDKFIEQIIKNVNKPIKVVKLVNLSESVHIDRGLIFGTS